MSEEQAERAVELLYSEVSARDELTDDEAEVLLRWGEEQVMQLADQDLEDAQFDEALEHLFRLLSRINRFTARRADLPLDEQQEALGRIAAAAEALAGYTPSAHSAAPLEFEAYLQQQPALDNIANIRALTALIARATTGDEHEQTDDRYQQGRQDNQDDRDEQDDQNDRDDPKPGFPYFRL